MSLRKLTFLLIAITTVGLVGVVLFNTTRILRTHFERQEKSNLYFDIRSVNNAIDQQIAFLDYTSNDWANWDDTYNFVETKDLQYVLDNLQPITYQNLDLDLMIMVDNSFDVVYAGMIEKTGQFSNRVPQEIADHLQPNGLFPADRSDGSTRDGLISIRGQPMMIISHPIQKTDGSGPSHGRLLMGKYLDQPILDTIDSLLSLTVEVQALSNVSQDEQYAAALAYTLTDQDPYYVTLTPNEARGYAVLDDVFGQPSLVLMVKRYPAILNNSYLVNNYLFISVISTAVTFTTILFLLIEFNVLTRIRHLSRDVQAIGTSGDINKRVVVDRKDELSSLASKINDMLGALESANQERRESEERFRTLVESMDDMVFTVDREDQDIHVYERKRSPHATLPSAGLIARAAIIRADLKRELSGQPGLMERAFRGESTVMEWSTQTDGAARNFITTLSPIYNAQSVITSVVGVSKDITSQKKLERDLRNRINELGALFNVSQQLLGEIEEETVHVVICRLAVEQIGMDAAWIAVRSPDESVLQPVASWGLPADMLKEVALTQVSERPLHPVATAYNQKELILYGASFNDPYTRQSPEQTPEAAIPLMQSGAALAMLVLIRKEEPYIRKEALPLIQAYVNLASVAIQNASLFKQVLKGRERLQAMSSQLVEVQEEERRQIALELHDEIGQALTGLRFSVNKIPSLSGQAVKDQVETCVSLTNDLIARVRQMSLSLRPSMLDDLGIIPTLIWYFDRYTAQTGIEVQFRHNNLVGRRFSPDIEITVFRVVQEALTNVARYAGVKTCNVHLWCNDQTVGMQIEDQGVGFDQEQALNSHDTQGLLGMRERVGFLRGMLSIVTQPGEGTCLTAEIPLAGYMERRKRDRTGSLGR